MAAAPGIHVRRTIRRTRRGIKRAAPWVGILFVASALAFLITSQSA